MKKILILIMAIALSGCSLFHIQKQVITQGNIITPAMTSQLHIGMSEGEVRDVMGNPVLLNVFSPNRIEYIYTYQKGIHPREVTRVSCIFRDGRLVAIKSKG